MARKYTCNFNYFDNIDTEEKSLLARFFMGDGYVVIRKDGLKGGSLKVSLMKEDAGHLEKLKEFMNCDKDVLFYKISSDVSKDSEEARFVVYNISMARLLQDKYGMVPRRSDFNKIITKVPNELHKHLLRGIFDADGSFLEKRFKESRSGSSEWSASLIASDSLLDWHNELLLTEGISKTTYKRNIRHEGRDENMKTIHITGNNVVFTLMDYLYKDAKVFLDRKYNKYIELKKYLQNRGRLI